MGGPWSRPVDYCSLVPLTMTISLEPSTRSQGSFCGKQRCRQRGMPLPPSMKSMVDSSSSLRPAEENRVAPPEEPMWHLHCRNTEIDVKALICFSMHDECWGNADNCSVA